MARVWQLLVRADGDTRGAQRDLRRLKSATRNLKKSVVGDFGSIARVGAAAFGVGLALSVRAGVTELMESQQVAAQSAAALRSTGNAANTTGKHISKLATKLSQMSGADDELIQQGENLILTFTNIRNAAGKGNDVFDQTTKAALDMSVALGEDMTSSAMRIGKALNDPIKGVAALRRVGVQLSKAQEKQIKTAMKHNDVMGAQKIILKELNKEFGGSAAARGKTAAGAVGRLKNAYDDLTASIISQVAPALGDMATKMLATVRSVQAWSGTREGQDAIASLRDGISTLSNVLGASVRFLVDHRREVVALGVAYATFRVASYIGGIVTAMNALRVATLAAAESQGLLSAAFATNPIGIIAVGVGLAAGAMMMLRGHTNKATDAIKQTTAANRKYMQSVDEMRSQQLAASDAAFGLIDAKKREREAVHAAKVASDKYGKNSKQAKDAAYESARASAQYDAAQSRLNETLEKGTQASRKNAGQVGKDQTVLSKSRDRIKLLQKAYEGINAGGPKMLAADNIVHDLSKQSDELKKINGRTVNDRQDMQARLGQLLQAEIVKRDAAKRRIIKGAKEIERNENQHKKNINLIRKNVGNVLPGSSRFLKGLRKAAADANKIARTEKKTTDTHFKKIGNVQPNMSVLQGAIARGLAATNTTASTAAFTVGQSIGAGVERGIGSTLTDLANAGARAAEAALAAARRTAKTASPSKRAIKEVGEPIGQGIEVGITNRIGSIKRASKKAVDAALGFMGTYAGLDETKGVKAENKISKLESTLETLKSKLESAKSALAAAHKTKGQKDDRAARALMGRIQASMNATNKMLKKTKESYNAAMKYIRALEKLNRKNSLMDAAHQYQIALMGGEDAAGAKDLMLKWAQDQYDELRKLLLDNGKKLGMDARTQIYSQLASLLDQIRSLKEDMGGSAGETIKPNASGTFTQPKSRSMIGGKTTQASSGTVINVYPQSQDVEAIARRVAYIISSGQVRVAG